MSFDESDQAIKDKVQTVWELTVQLCNRVLHHADVYGFGLMSIPDPNVHQMHRLLTVVVLPVLEKIANDDNLGPDDGVRIENIRQYIKHLSDIVVSIKNCDSDAFDTAVAALNKEAML